MKYLLDTNAVSALMRGESRFLKRMLKNDEADIGLSGIVLHELFYGAFHSPKRDEILRRIDRIPFSRLGFEESDARCAGEIRAALRSRGTPIGPYDVLIAGQALARGLTVVTDNVTEFARVDGLVVENWRE